MSLQGLHKELLKKEHQVRAERGAMLDFCKRNNIDPWYRKEFKILNRELTTVERMLKELEYGLKNLGYYI